MTQSKHYHDRSSITATAMNGFDITPHATEDLPQITRAVMVSTDGVVITGYLEGTSTTPHTTFPLLPGLMYSFAFKRITTVTGGTVKGYN